MAKPNVKTTVRKSVAKQKLEDKYLIESAWEVCNQVGGIYTVIRSKVPVMVEKWGDNYCLLGPLLNKDLFAEFEEHTTQDNIFGKTAAALKRKGFNVKYGRWLVYGRPQVILLDPHDAFYRLNEIKAEYKKQHDIEYRNNDDLYHQVLGFADMCNVMFKSFSQRNKENKPLTVHFHEWMTVLPALGLAKSKRPVRTVYTTHATLLGRYLAMNENDFYSRIDEFDWKKSADRFNITSMVQIERAGAEHVNAFTTVSDVTGLECEHLLGKKVDCILPNGLNIQRFVAYHEVQNLHQKYKDEIHEFVMGHFFQSYSFDLDKVMYFFTSGRFEFVNKGYDITLEALKRLNAKMKKAKSEITVVMFFVTKKPVWSINPDVLHSRGVMEEIRKNCEEITKQVGKKLFEAAASAQTDFRLPSLNKFVDDYWMLRYRRTLQSWKGDKWPIVVTHNLVDDVNDEILAYLRNNKMINSPDDKVKVVYHPEFISPTSPLFGLEYSDFVRGCHLGIFPSYYEPWGYTPLESIALGVPTITSDLSGFGGHVKNNVEKSEERGVYILDRFNQTYDEAAEDMAQMMFDFVHKSRKERMTIRNKSEDLSEDYDWSKLIKYYVNAYQKAWQEK